ncbi:MAG: hypothetical protein ACOCXQ_01890 [Patescibacteria group bacterium]
MAFKRPHPFIAALVIVIVVLSGWYLIHQRQFDYHSSETTRIQPVTPSPNDARLWVEPSRTDEVLFNFFQLDPVDVPVKIILQHPEQGGYCNGCIDGWPSNNPPKNIRGVRITGSFFRPESVRDWLLTAGVIQPVNEVTGDVDQAIIADFQKLIDAEIGESVSVNSDAWWDAEITRIENSTSEGEAYEWYQYQGINTNASYALLSYQDFWILLSYQYMNPLYDVFPEIINTVQIKPNETINE